MKKQVLLYNFEGERLSEVKRTLLPLKTAVVWNPAYLDMEA